MPRADNFIVVHGWMVDELNLHGNELLVYALIYGFSQDGESEFQGSTKYIMEWLGVKSRTTVAAVLKSLEGRNLIEKRPCEYNGVMFNRYRSKNGRGVQKLNRGCTEIGQPHVQNLNTDNIENINNKKDRVGHPTVEQVKEYCEERKNNVDPQRFVDYYEANGWKVGKNPMKDWKACVRNWERSEQQKRKPTNSFDNYQGRDIDYDALLNQL